MDEQRICPGCKKPLPADAPMGLCPECLIKSGFPTGMETDTGSAMQPPFTPPAIEELARLFPQLEILELVGKGGMGAVYKARQKQLNRFVALKILPPDIGRDPAFAGRFMREAQALAQLNHPGIVTLYEFGETSGQYYFLMEFVDGVNLRQLLATSRVSPREALAIVPQICDALQYAHDQGIVHRDIKPENILLDRRGRVKVADFGLAKLVGAGNEPAADNAFAAGSPSLTEAGKVMGTPNYMSPEQLKNPNDVDHRADIYALGVVFYQMLTGELPDKQLQLPSTKVQIDVRLDEIVLRALEKKPELRYQQASVFKTQIETISNSPEKAQNPKSAAGSRIPKAALAWAVASLAVIVILAMSYLRPARSVTVVQAPRTNTSPATIETWAPTLTPGEKPDLQKIMDDAKALMGLGHYEESLQRHIWFHNHEPEFGDPYQNIVRISSALTDWVELGRRYPKAKEALLTIRDEDTRALLAGTGNASLFTDVKSINSTLQDEETSYALFKKIREKDPKLAAHCYFWIESFLVTKGEYQYCYDHMGDPETRFDSIRRGYEMEMFNQRQANESRQRALQILAKTNQQSGRVNIPPYVPPDRLAHNKKYTESRFVDQTRQLIEIMVGAGHKADAEKMRDEAIAVLDDPRLQSAVSDVEKNIEMRKAALSNESSNDPIQTSTGQPPVVVETFPECGATDVEPGEVEVRVRFSKRMEDHSWSWVAAWPDSAPEMIGQPRYEADGRTCVIKVRLEAGRTYGWWLNNDEFKNFKDSRGRAAVPYLFTFQTKPN